MASKVDSWDRIGACRDCIHFKGEMAEERGHPMGRCDAPDHGGTCYLNAYGCSKNFKLKSKVTHVADKGRLDCTFCVHFKGKIDGMTGKCERIGICYWEGGCRHIEVKQPTRVVEEPKPKPKISLEEIEALEKELLK